MIQDSFKGDSAINIECEVELCMKILKALHTPFY